MVVTGVSGVRGAESGSTGSDRRSQITTRWRARVVTLHLVAAVSLIGTDLVLVALGVAGAQGADPRTVFPAASVVEGWLVAPLVVITLGTGLWLAIGSRWGLVRYWWVTIKLATSVAFTGIVLFLLIPRLANSAHLAMSGQSFTLAERLPLAIVPAFAILVLIANVILARVKPAWRVRSAQPDHR